MTKEKLIADILLNGDKACKAVYVGPGATEQVAGLVGFYNDIRVTLLAYGANAQAVEEAMPDLPEIVIP